MPAHTRYTRRNAWENGGTFDNPDLLWYARGVADMQQSALNEPSSWWFFAAIHGEYVKESGFPGWGFLPDPPPAPNSPEPTQAVADLYWNQCQHQTWFFLPWHRGYLIALEAQIRAHVLQRGGPATWALPYWDYFGPGQQSIPPAFTQETLPDGAKNALFVKARYGPNSDGNIFIPMPPVSQDCLSNDLFTGSSPNTPPPGFGGRVTGFWHGGGRSGNLESNPHNIVHVFIGGESPSGDGTYGLMSDPGLAGLDPIFYLHHANIDRMWAGWNQLGNANPTDANWLNGPAASGEHEFAMPLNGTEWKYTPQEMSRLETLNYTYDSLPQPAPVTPLLTERRTRLGLGAAGPEATLTEGKSVELLGANQEPLPIKGSGADTTVTLDTSVRSKVAESLSAAEASSSPDRIFLRLENVRGTHDASVLDVYLNVPAGDNPRDHPELRAGSVGLFGLRRASMRDARHGGGGLNLELEVSKIIDSLHLNAAFDVSSLNVRIVPHRAVPEKAEITVGRVSLYRQGK